jgi:hypothetical protein
MTRQNILIIGIIALIVVVAGLMMVFASQGTEQGPETLSVSKAPTPDEMKALAADIAARIDGDAIAALQPGDENTSAYTAVHDQLNAIRKANPEILYIYIMRKTENATEYVVDADYGSGDGAEIGYAYHPTDADAAFLAGFTDPSAEGFYIDEWNGTIYTATSGYAPITGSTGAVVGMVGVDVGSVVTEETLKNLAAEAAARIDGDALAALEPGDENASEFIAIHDQLDAFRDTNPGVLYAYTMRKVGNTTEYIVDADYGSSSYAVAIGDIYVPTEEQPAFLNGFVEPSAKFEIYTAQWGNVIATVISGYAPVKDSTGAVVGLVGVDMGSEEVIANTETASAQKALTQDDMKALAVEIAGRIDGDAIAALQPGDEKSSAFVAIRDQLDAFRASNAGVEYVYTMRQAGNVTEYVVDADWDSGDYTVAIGDVSSLTEEDAYFAGFTEPFAEAYTVVYGYAPIRNAAGAGVGMVCISMRDPIAQDNLEALAADIAGRIDGDAMAALQPGDENTPAYTAIQDQIKDFRAANPGIGYIYTMRKTENATEYVVDADYGDGYTAKIGYDYTPMESDTAFLAGFTEPSAALYTAISGCAPIRNTTGAGVGMVCVDTDCTMISQERLESLAAEIAGKIDSDALAALRPGGENTTAFIAVRDHLDAFRDANAGVVYVYTMRKVGDTVEYVVDADYGTGDAPGIGGLCNNTDPEMVAGFTEPAAESEFSIEQWGNDTTIILSGYAPVKDSTGAIVGVVGVDMGRLQ